MAISPDFEFRAPHDERHTEPVRALTEANGGRFDEMAIVAVDAVAKFEGSSPEMREVVDAFARMVASLARVFSSTWTYSRPTNAMDALALPAQVADDDVQWREL